MGHHVFLTFCLKSMSLEVRIQKKLIDISNAQVLSTVCKTFILWFYRIFFLPFLWDEINWDEFFVII